jgi:hypothetical protein
MRGVVYFKALSTNKQSHNGKILMNNSLLTIKKKIGHLLILN